MTCSSAASTGVAGAEVLAGHRDVAENRAEDVVEIVGDAARQRADRLDLLRLAQLRLEREALDLGALAAADVADERGELVFVLAAQRGDGQLDRDLAAVAVQRLDLDQAVQDRPGAAARKRSIP
jgi:hypothetical protein